MDREVIGSHTVATKERMLFVPDEAVARHEALHDTDPPDL